MSPAPPPSQLLSMFAAAPAEPGLPGVSSAIAADQMATCSAMTAVSVSSCRFSASAHSAKFTVLAAPPRMRSMAAVASLQKTALQQALPLHRREAACEAVRGCRGTGCVAEPRLRSWDLSACICPLKTFQSAPWIGSGRRTDLHRGGSVLLLLELDQLRLCLQRRFAPLELLRLRFDRLCSTPAAATL